MSFSKKFFKLAREVAEYRQDHRNFLLGAVGIRKDGVIVCSSNSPIKIDPGGSNRGYFSEAHAEFRVSKKLDVGAEVYVVRVRRGDKKICNARPCKTCRAKMRNRGVRIVYYSISENENGIEWGTLVP